MTLGNWATLLLTIVGWGFIFWNADRTAKRTETRQALDRMACKLKPTMELLEEISTCKTRKEHLLVDVKQDAFTSELLMEHKRIRLRLSSVQLNEEFFFDFLDKINLFCILVGENFQDVEGDSQVVPLGEAIQKAFHDTHLEVISTHLDIMYDLEEAFDEHFSRKLFEIIEQSITKKTLWFLIPLGLVVMLLLIAVVVFYTAQLLDFLSRDDLASVILGWFTPSS